MDARPSCFIFYTGPFKNYPQLTVYHPSANGTGPGGRKMNAFVNVGFTGRNAIYIIMPF